MNENGTLYYAGRRDFNSFTLANGNNPTMCRVMDGVREAYAYFDNMVILDEIGSVYVYGLNTQNAIGSKVTNQAPQKLLDGVVSIASGYGFSAFLTEDGSILVQGDNTFAQAGNGSVGGSVTLSVIPEFN